MKVFIASSIVEFEHERDIVENYLWRQNSDGNLSVIPLRCENIDPAMSVTRKEDDYCNYIAESDVCLFILGKKVGQYTVEEYDYAQKMIREGKSIKILAFCKGQKSDPFYKRIQDDNIESYDYCDEQSLINLLNDHMSFCNTCDNQPRSDDSSVYIFLASSIREDSRQNRRIENFIWHMNFEFSEKYNLSVMPLSNSTSAHLERIIDKSAMCFFIVFGKVENEVVEELKIAKNRLDKQGAPRIYVYFKTVNGDEESSVTQFKNYLDSELKHFYGTFDSIDTIKLRILLNVAILKTGSQEVCLKDGKCYLGENMAIDVHNVSEFANNQKLRELKTELDEIGAQYRLLRADYNRDPSDNDVCAAYLSIASKYDKLKKDVAAMEENIFSVSLSMSKDESGGSITDNQKRAYALFVNGEVEKAIEMLDIDESLDVYSRAANYAKQAALNVISEGRQKIYFLTTMRQYSKRDELIEDTYKKIIPVATAQQLELDVYNEYALFLKNCDRHKEALEQALRLQSLYSLFPPTNSLEIAENLTLIAMIYADLSDCQQQTIDCSLKSIAIREDALAHSGYDEKNYVGLARSCKTLGSIYRKANSPELAEKYLSRAEELFNELESRADKYLTEQAEAFIARGINFAEQFESNKAFASFDKAIKLWNRHKTDDPHARYVQSSAYQNQASLTKKEGRLQEATELLFKALEIRKELADCNPARYLPTLAFTYQGIGNAYRATDGQLNLAVEYFAKAYELRKKICLVNKSAHEVELSDSCIKICGTLLDLKRPDDALPYLEEGYEIRRRLYDCNRKTYERWFAQTLFEFGRYYEQKNDLKKAEEYYDQAFAIRTKISEENLQPNIEGLHDSFTKMKLLYGSGFKNRLSQNESALYDKLYAFVATDTKTGKSVQFKTSFYES